MASNDGSIELNRLLGRHGNEHDHTGGENRSVSGPETSLPNGPRRPAQDPAASLYSLPSSTFESAVHEPLVQSSMLDDSDSLSGAARRVSNSGVTHHSELPEKEGLVSALSRHLSKQSTSVPWTLRPASLLGFLCFLAALIIALEVLNSFSAKYQGLVESSPDAAYLWKYLPTASVYLLSQYKDGLI